MKLSYAQLKDIQSYILANSKQITPIMDIFAKFRSLLLILSKIGFIIAALYIVLTISITL